MTDTQEPPKVTEQPLLMYSWVCPFVHRATLALAFKEAEIPKVAIDLKNKPDWLPKYSPHGKVPTITYLEDGKQQVLYESLALVFWVDEYFKEGPQLMPVSAAQRTIARIIMSRFDTSFVPLWYGALRSQDVEEFTALLPKLRAELTWLEEHMHPEGPFLLGAQPTLTDAAVAPWLLRYGVIQHYKNVDILSQHPKIKAYTERLRQLPAVANTLQSPSGSGWEAWSKDMAGAYEGYGKQQLDYSAVDN